MVKRIQFFFLISILLLTLQVKGTIFHPVSIGQEFNPWVLEESLNCDLGSNGSFFIGFRGWCPVLWNSTTPVPLEYGLNFQDEAEFHPVHLTVFFRVNFFNAFGDPTYSAKKTVFSYSSTDKQFFDAFRTPLFWNLSTSETNISSGDSWEGQLVMNATIKFDIWVFTKVSNTFNITYKYTSIRSGGSFIPPNVVFGGVLLGVIVIIISIQIRNRKI